MEAEQQLAYVVSADKELLSKLLKLHLTAVNESKRKIGVKLVGCPYSTDEFDDLEEYNNNVIEFKAERRRFFLAH